MGHGSLLENFGLHKNPFKKKKESLLISSSNQLSLKRSERN